MNIMVALCRLGTRLPTNTFFIVYSLICRGLISLGGSSCYTTAVSLAAQEVPRDFAFLIVSATSHSKGKSCFLRGRGGGGLDAQLEMSTDLAGL